MGLKEEVIKMKKEVNQVKEQTWASEIISDYKKQNKRQFVIILVILIMWFITIGYLVYVLNDIGIEETTTTKTQEISEVDTMSNSNIVNGDFNDKDKTNNENN